MVMEEDPRRRRQAPGAGGYEGVGGAAALPGQILPFLLGQRPFDYSGPGLQGYLESMRGGGQQQPSPAFRHFQGQGLDFMPPGLDSRNGIGGPNVAPGNINNGQALDQPQGNQTPGVPQGVPFGPQTQGWRNYAPGYRETARVGYGTPAFGQFLSGGAPAAPQLPPGAREYQSPLDPKQGPGAPGPAGGAGRTRPR